MIFIVSFCVFAAIVAGMAIGVMNGREPLKGSCGGVGKLGIDQKCDLCGGDPQRCETETRVEGSGAGVETFDLRR